MQIVFNITKSGQVTEQQAGEDKGICELHKAISNQQYRNTMDVEHLLNYSSKSDAVMKSPTDEEIINSRDNEYVCWWWSWYDTDDSCILLNVSPKEAF